MKRDRTMKRRRQLARSLERAAVAERPFVGRGPRYLVQPTVASACAPSLRALAVALRDETRPVNEEGLAAVQTFILHGDSPFFGRDATEALREAVRVQHVVVGAERAVLDQEFRNLRRTAAAVVGTIALAVAFAVLTVPSALAAGRCPCNEGLPSSGQALNQLYGSAWTRVSPAELTTLVAAFGGDVTTTMTPQRARAELARGQGLNRLAKQYAAPTALKTGEGCPCNEDLPFSGQALTPITPRIGEGLPSPQQVGVPFYTPKMLAAHYNHEDALYERSQSIPTVSNTIGSNGPGLSDSPAGFDWSAAAIGAGIVAALFLMIAGIGAMTIKARKSQRSGRLSVT